MTNIENIIDALMFPSRTSRTFINSGASYPPYNIIKLNDTETLLELALAGFTKDELSVVVEDDKLKISANPEGSAIVTDYIYKGIAKRSFERSFKLSSDAVVKSSAFEDGILSILVEYIIPEEKKPRKIEIGSSLPFVKSEKQIVDHLKGA